MWGCPRNDRVGLGGQEAGQSPVEPLHTGPLLALRQSGPHRFQNLPQPGVDHGLHLPAQRLGHLAPLETQPHPGEAVDQLGDGRPAEGRQPGAEAAELALVPGDAVLEELLQECDDVRRHVLSQPGLDASPSPDARRKAGNLAGMRTSGVADLTGRVLAGRYRLVAPIGTGASGRVYAAWDVRLQRKVAVKVLHAALADDAGFLRRFGAEAQMAASLHHPNVVAVYDWGEDETPFMVLELLEGGSLRSLLDRGQRLTPAQAAAVGRQVAAGLDYAHARGLVHRDVKPANLLFDEHGTVRVADFGLARALAEASWTEPAGAVLGTARYAAPEQVRGVVDARSDEYSLALVLVEAVTGTVPFAADTSLTTLLARVERHLEVPAELGALAPVLERAGRAEPADRYPDARSFGAALAGAAGSLPPPDPITLAGPTSIDFDPHPTEIRPAPPPAPTPEPASGGGGRAPSNRWWRSPCRRRRGDPGALRYQLPAAVSRAREAGGAGVPSGSFRSWCWLSCWWRRARRPSPSPRPPAPGCGFPTWSGATRRRPSDAAAKVDLRVRTRPTPSDDPAGTVVRQDPAPGTLAGRRVTLWLSDGPPPVDLPRVTGVAEAAARVALENAGFVVTTGRRTDEDVPAGQVVGQQPSTERAAPGSEIHLVISDGPRPVEVPNVVGESYDDAAEALTAKRFTVNRQDEYSDTVPAGRVIRHDPVAGADAPRDSTVILVVSLGPDRVIVGDYEGETVEDAVDALEEAGLQVDVVDYRPGRRVKHQDPPEGTKLRRNETVTLYL